MKTKILVTGDRGFIGSNLKNYLQKKYDGFGWDIKDGFDIFEDAFEYAVKTVDIVIHLAALTSVEKSFKHPDDYFYTNVLGTARVAQLCMKYKKKLIFLSSASVYDRLSSPYASSKALGEDIVRKVPNSVILRCFNVYGEYMNKGTIMYNFSHSKVLEVNGDGKQTRDFIHVLDVCKIIEKSFKWKGLFEVGSGKSVTVNKIASLFNKPVRYLPKKQEIRHSKADISKLRKLYKGKFIPLEEGIKWLN